MGLTELKRKRKLLKLYKIYLSQGYDNSKIFFYHDDSGGHPDYHVDQHDNYPRLENISINHNNRVKCLK